MKKVIPIILLVAILATFAACNGAAITPNEHYDMSDGLLTNEYKEITFTVASYNIKGGEATVESVSGINQNLMDMGVDIAGLQEVDNFSKRSGKKDFLGIFRSGKLSNISFCPLMLKGFGDTYGLATISRTPFTRSHPFKLPYPYKYEKSNVEKRIITRTLILINGMSIAFYNTHLSYEEIAVANGKSLRSAQFDFILALLDSDPCPYKIVTGDFNVLSFEEFDTLTENGYNIVNNSANKFDTYRGDDAEFLALDNIIYSSSLALLSSGANNSDYSDHNMLYATFKTVK